MLLTRADADARAIQDANGRIARFQTKLSTREEIGSSSRGVDPKSRRELARAAEQIFVAPRLGSKYAHLLESREGNRRAKKHSGADPFRPR